jgi:hypothetical protein
MLILWQLMCNILTIYSIKEKNNRRREKRIDEEEVDKWGGGVGAIANNDYDD